MARKAQITTSSNALWSGGTPFNGYVLVTMALPSKDGTPWDAAYLRDTRPVLRIPTRVKVPIREGVIDTSTQVWRTDTITPPNVKYSFFFYDTSDRLIANGATGVAITADTYTLTVPTLTEPT